MTAAENWSACREALRQSLEPGALETSKLWNVEGSDVREVPQDTEIKADTHACALFQKGADRSRLVYISNGLAKLSGSDASHLQDQGSLLLMPGREWLNTLLNGEEVQRITQFHEAVLVQNQKPTPIIVGMIMKHGSGSAFWTLIHLMQVEVEGVQHVLHHYVGLLQPVSKLLWPDDDANMLEIDHSLVTPILQPMRKLTQGWKGSESLSKDMMRRVKSVAMQIDELLSEGIDAGESGSSHFVPRLGLSAAKAFETSNKLDKVKQAIRKQLGSSWGQVEHQDGTRSEVAWLLSDLRQPDQPVVHMSKAAQEMTGFTLDWAKGRNLRFLQVRDSNLNQAYNGAELTRVGRFVEDDSTEQNEELYGVVLHQNNEEEHVWTLVYMRHVRLSGGAHYLLTIVSPVAAYKDLVSELLPSEPTPDALYVAARLRETLAQHQRSFRSGSGEGEGEGEEETEESNSFNQNNLHTLAETVVCRWILDVGKRVKDSWEGGIYCPVLGLPAVKEFSTFWPEVETTHLRTIFRECEVEVNGKVMAAVSSTEALDFPIVHLSQGFEEITGYHMSFALGRNCRFLQLKDTQMSKALNGREVEAMKVFCTRKGEDGKTIQGDTELFFLINETVDGDRFWNMLIMRHIQVRGHDYILGVQTRLDLPMPRIIERPTTSMADVHGAAAFAESLGWYLDDFRPQLRDKRCYMHTIKHVKIVEERILMYLKKSCDDYEGDHYVPRRAEDVARTFKQDPPSWMAALEEIKEDKLAWFVIDLDSPIHCVVAASSNLAEVSGYPPEYTYGRNYRFFLPKVQKRDKLLNDTELSKIHEEITETPKPMVLLLEGRDRKPYWAAWVWEGRAPRAVNAEDDQAKGYAVVKFMRLDSIIDKKNHALAWILNDMLVMDPDAMAEVARLRKLVQKLPPAQMKKSESIKGPLKRCLEGWACRAPAAMSWPTRPVQGVDYSVPTFGLEIRTTYALLPLMPQALESGLRHFSFVFQSSCDGGAKDQQAFAMEGRLFGLKLAHAFSDMNKSNYNYMYHQLVISLRTAPQSVGCFQETLKALQSHGQSVALWLLDVSGQPSTAAIQEAWKTMSDMKEQGQVAALGMYGGGEKQIEAVMNLNRHPIAVYACELQGRDVEAVWARAVKNSPKANAANIAMPVFQMHVSGQRNEMVNSEGTEALGEELGVPPALLAAKWAENKGMLLLANPLTVPGMTCEADSQPIPEEYPNAEGLVGVLEPVPPVVLPSADRNLCTIFRSDILKGQDLDALFSHDKGASGGGGGGGGGKRPEQGGKVSAATKLRATVGAVNAAHRMQKSVVNRPGTTSLAFDGADDENQAGENNQAMKSASSRRGTHNLEDVCQSEGKGLSRKGTQEFGGDSRHTGRDRGHPLRPLKADTCSSESTGSGGSTTARSSVDSSHVPRPPTAEQKAGQQGSPLLRRMRKDA